MTEIRHRALHVSEFAAVVVEHSWTLVGHLTYRWPP